MVYFQSLRLKLNFYKFSRKKIIWESSRASAVELVNQRFLVLMSILVYINVYIYIIGYEEVTQITNICFKKYDVLRFILFVCTYTLGFYSFSLTCTHDKLGKGFRPYLLILSVQYYG